VGQPHRSEEDRIRRGGPLENLLGHRHTRPPIGLGAGLEVGEGEAEAADPALDGLEHAEGGLHDLGPDPVAGHDGDVEGGLVHGRSPFNPAGCARARAGASGSR